MSDTRSNAVRAAMRHAHFAEHDPTGASARRIAQIFGPTRRLIPVSLGYLLFLILIVVSTNFLLDLRARQLISEQAGRYSVAWAEFVGAGLKNHRTILSGDSIDPADIEFLRAALHVRDIFRFKLFDETGRLLLDSRDLGRPNPLRRRADHSDTARWALTLNEAVATISTDHDDPSRPAVYVETYVPLIIDGMPIGVAEVYIDQVDATQSIESNFLELGLVTGAAMAVALLFPTGWLFVLLRRLDRQNERLTHHKRRAEEAERIKADFIARMSHDLRTPLNSIIGFTDLMRTIPEIAASPEKCREYASLIHRSGHNMLALVNDILELSAIESGKRARVPVPIDLATALADCAKELRPMADRKNVALTIAIDPDCAAPIMDDQSFNRALGNLLSNAVKFSPAGESIEIHATPADDRVSIAVRDHGPGIRPALLQTITDPFTQGEQDPFVARNGVGLGLSIVKALLEENQGELRIENATGGSGTIATIILPSALDA
ncbi:HAMP domain-containing histidine kinase [Marivibrio halodurans]|uniref:histidine kinase n=1 Tax=Marivibrio halodurans TaxID=2039722 RepID=A0A8J7SL98_9PROT|nr:HAMP domain-containing sensor histidine kinase [Marivibrio halodurans]MBP5856071.1 HAMP domain-containing histidine kinase [Marivibrio halodurans]